MNALPEPNDTNPGKINAYYTAKTKMRQSIF